MLISDGINHGKLQSIIVGELKKAGLKHRLKKIILKSVKVGGFAFVLEFVRDILQFLYRFNENISFRTTRQYLERL